MPVLQIQEMDSFRTEEFKRMSRIERELAMNDLHCCPDTPCEDGSFVGLRMGELDVALQEEVNTNSDISLAYQLAQSMDSRYAENHRLRLAFLRAERFQPRPAARRLMGFFAEKMMLWGPSKLDRDITLADFNVQDMETLKSGKFQLLEDKDQSGRQVISHVISDQEETNETSLLRVMYYLTLASMEEEENQHLGLVGLTYYAPNAFRAEDNHNAGEDSIPAFHARLAQLRNVLPVRYASLHYCINGNHPFVASRINTEIEGLDSQNRARSRVHSQVSTIELRFILSSFGLSQKNLPVSVFGTVRTAPHQAWVQAREAKEKIVSSPITKLVQAPLVLSHAPIIPQDDFRSPVPVIQQGNCVSTAPVMHHGFCGSNLIPGDIWDRREPLPSIHDTDDVKPSFHDVLFGRGKVKEHPGNILLHSLIDKRRFRYETAPKWGKTVIAEEIVSIIREKCGRFLKCESAKEDESKKWVVVGKDEAREKVAHTFRSKRSTR